MLSAFAMSSLFPSVNAAASLPTLSVTPSVSRVDIGSEFGIALEISNIQNLASFEITLAFDETQLEYAGFAAVADPFIKVSELRLPGFLRVGGAIFGGGSISVPESGSAPLWSQTFQLALPGTSDLEIARSDLGVLGVGGVEHRTVEAVVMSSDKAIAKLNTARSTTPTADLSQGETTIDLQANLVNNGMGVVHGIVVWRLISLSGTAFGFKSAAFTLGPGEDVRQVTKFAFEQVPDTFDGAALLIVSPGTVRDDSRVLFTDLLASSDAKIRFVDADNDNVWDSGEIVVYDTDGDRKYDTGPLGARGGVPEPVIAGSAPANQTSLKNDSKIKYDEVNGSGVRESAEAVIYDANSNGFYDPGLPETVIAGAWTGNNIRDPVEPIVYDSNNNGAYDTGEPTISAGAVPVNGNPLEDDSKIRYHDADEDMVWDSGELVFYDTDNSGAFNTEEPIINGAFSASDIRSLQSPFVVKA